MIQQTLYAFIVITIRLSQNIKVHWSRVHIRNKSLRFRDPTALAQENLRISGHSHRKKTNCGPPRCKKTHYR